MYAAAGASTLAGRHARRNLRKQTSGGGGRPPRTLPPLVRPPPSPRPPPHPHPPHQTLPPPPQPNGRLPSFCSEDLDFDDEEGRAAWQERERERERERRLSTTEVAVSHRNKASEAHRRWMKRNRIHDSSYGGSSSDDDESATGLYGRPDSFGNRAANTLLYCGLGAVAIGLVISFVGTGEKGFKTLELRLIGPSLIIGGVACCLLRTLMCLCQPICCNRRRRRRRRHGNGHHKSRRRHSFFHPAQSAASKTCEDIAMADHTTLLLRPPGPPPPIQQPQPPPMPSTSLLVQNELSVNIPNFICSDDEDDDNQSHRHLRRYVPPPTAKLLDIEMRTLHSDRDRESGPSHDRCVTFLDGLEDDSSKVPATKTAKLRSPAVRVVPDTGAHRLEELKSKVGAAASFSGENSADRCLQTTTSLISSPQHSEKEVLLHSEIVLSPAKLQQDVRDQ